VCNKVPLFKGHFTQTIIIVNQLESLVQRLNKLEQNNNTENPAVESNPIRESV